MKALFLSIAMLMVASVAAATPSGDVKSDTGVGKGGAVFTTGVPGTNPETGGAVIRIVISTGTSTTDRGIEAP